MKNTYTHKTTHIIYIYTLGYTLIFFAPESAYTIPNKSETKQNRRDTDRFLSLYHKYFLSEKTHI